MAWSMFELRLFMTLPYETEIYITSRAISIFHRKLLQELYPYPTESCWWYYTFARSTQHAGVCFCWAYLIQLLHQIYLYLHRKCQRCRLPHHHCKDLGLVSIWYEKCWLLWNIFKCCMRKTNIEIPFKITEQTGRKKPITDDGICRLLW